MRVNSFQAAPEIVGIWAITIHFTPLCQNKLIEREYNITPMPVIRLAEGDEDSSLNPAKDPSSRNGVSGSRRRRTLSRAIINPVEKIATEQQSSLLMSLFIVFCPLGCAPFQTFLISFQDFCPVCEVLAICLCRSIDWKGFKKRE